MDYGGPYYLPLPAANMRVRQDRLREDLLTNGEFGLIDSEGYGRTVLTGSEADRKARERFVEVLERLGMEVWVDAIGNIAGRWVADSANPDAAPVVAGSHLDSVPRGGIFDGPLGVYAAVEAVRAMQDAGANPDRPIQVVSFTEEEGQRFDVGTLGSSVAAGELSVEEALSQEDDSGTTVAEHLDRIGFRGEKTLDVEAWDSWFEIHIEQSKTLEAAGVPVGVVTAISGIANCQVEIVGEADHAGGTHMDDRSDALLAATEFVQDVNDVAHEIVETKSEFAVATVGNLEVEPNARNVVPGRIEIRTDFRDTDLAMINTIIDRAEQSLARIAKQHGVETSLDHYRTAEPAQMSDRCLAAVRAAADRRDIETMALPSGGGHDSMKIARVTDAGMLFVPSEGGISHSPKEWTDWEDCARAAEVLASAVADLAGADGFV